MLNALRKVRTIVTGGGIRTSIRRGGRFSKQKYVVYRSRLNNGYEIEIEGATVELLLSTREEVKTLNYILEEERRFIGEILDELETDDVVWDVGANIGIHSCIFGKKAGTVVCFEPYDPNVARLRENLEVNGICADINPIALSDRDGTEEISLPDEERPGNQWPALLPDSVPESRKEKLRNSYFTEVDVRRGDSVVKNGSPHPDVVKIDVEGAAFKVLDGLKGTLESDGCRAVFVEVHLPNSEESRPSVEDYGQNPEEITDRLGGFGFDVRTIQQIEGGFFVKGVK